MVDGISRVSTRPRATPCRKRRGPGRLAGRLDTHGGRYLEGLDPAASYAVLERRAPGAIRRYRSDAELRDLGGTGVSAGGVWGMRGGLGEGGFSQGPDRRLVWFRGGKVPCHGGHEGADRRRGHG